MSAQPNLPPSIRALIDAGRTAPSADNSQPWRFSWDEKHLTVRYDRQRVADKTFGPHEHATLLAMGAVKENILQMAAFLDIDVVQVETSTADPYFRFEFKFSTHEKVQTREHPLFQRHTNRFPYSSDAIPGEILESLNGMSQGQYRALIFSDRGLIKKIARWVRIASEIRFQSRDVHEFLGKSLRFTPEEANQGDGLDVRTLPLPPGGKMFLHLISDWERLALLNRLGCYKILASMEAKPVSEATHLVVIVGPDDSETILDAGMLMERIWIYLNSQGIAVHPYYVITDQLERLKTGRIPEKLSAPIKALKSEIQNSLVTNCASMHMLLRIGNPKKLPTRSLRLPWEKTTEFVST